MGKRRENHDARRAARLGETLLDTSRERDRLRALLGRIATDPRCRGLVDEDALEALGPDAARIVRAERQRDEMAATVARLTAAQLVAERRFYAAIEAIGYRSRYLALRAADAVKAPADRLYAVSAHGKPLEIATLAGDVISEEAKRPRKAAECGDLYPRGGIGRSIQHYEDLRRELARPRDLPATEKAPEVPIAASGDWAATKPTTPDETRKGASGAAVAAKVAAEVLADKAKPKRRAPVKRKAAATGDEPATLPETGATVH